MRMNNNVVENDGERKVMQLRADVGPAAAAATLAAMSWAVRSC